jgi:curved DNA-binding protein CbpA
MNSDRIPENIKDRINEFDQNLDRWTYYEILHISRNATIQDIKGGFRKMVALMHPDKYGHNLDPEYKGKLERIFNEINLAYTTLTDESERMKYDQSLYYAEDHGKPIKVGIDEQVAEAQFKRGIQALQKQEIVPAIEFFRSAVQLDNTNPEYHAKLALALSSHPNPRIQKEAVDACKEAIKLNHENANYHALMGRLYQKQEEYELAEVHYQRALSWNPQHQVARRELVSIKKEKQKHKPPGLASKLKAFLVPKKKEPEPDKPQSPGRR